MGEQSEISSAFYSSAAKGHVQHSSDKKLKGTWEKICFSNSLHQKKIMKELNCHLLLSANQYSTGRALVLSEFAM